MKNYETDFEFKARTSRELSNLIVNHMMKNHLTLEVLDLACDKVKEVFRKNASMSCYTGEK